MATKPTPGASDGTYGTELNAFLAVSLDVNGKIATEALQTDATAPSADAAVVNKKYVDDQLAAVVGTESDSHSTPTTTGYQFFDVNGSVVKVYTKYFTGTNTENDSSFSIVHGLDARNDILSVTAFIEHDTDADGFFGQATSAANRGFEINWDGTNITLQGIGSDLFSAGGNEYRIKVDYIP